jgi:hypothetical protein
MLAALVAAPPAALFPRSKVVARFNYFVSDFGAPGDPPPVIGGTTAESLEDLISNISHLDTPFMSLPRKERAKILPPPFNGREVASDDPAFYEWSDSPIIPVRWGVDW